MFAPLPLPRTWHPPEIACSLSTLYWPCGSGPEFLSFYSRYSEHGLQHQIMPHAGPAFQHKGAAFASIWKRPRLQFTLACFRAGIHILKCHSQRCFQLGQPCAAHDAEVETQPAIVSSILLQSTMRCMPGCLHVLFSSTYTFNEGKEPQQQQARHGQRPSPHGRTGSAFELLTSPSGVSRKHWDHIRQSASHGWRGTSLEPGKGRQIYRAPQHQVSPYLDARTGENEAD